MSKDKYRMTRKRIEKKLAAKCGVQVREVHEVIMKDVVNPLKRRQEAWQTAIRLQLVRRKDRSTACKRHTAGADGTGILQPR